MPCNGLPFPEMKCRLPYTGEILRHQLHFTSKGEPKLSQQLHFGELNNTLLYFGTYLCHLSKHIIY